MNISIMHVTPCSVIKALSSCISSRNAIFITSGQLSLGSSSFAEQLQLYTLILLPYRDTPRYTSVRCYCSMDYYLTIVSQVCKAFHQMYISYSELQYIVELGGQQLFPVPERDQQLSATPEGQGSCMVQAALRDNLYIRTIPARNKIRSTGISASGITMKARLRCSYCDQRPCNR